MQFKTTELPVTNLSNEGRVHFVQYIEYSALMLYIKISMLLSIFLTNMFTHNHGVRYNISKFVSFQQAKPLKVKCKCL